MLDGAPLVETRHSRWRLAMAKPHLRGDSRELEVALRWLYARGDAALLAPSITDLQTIKVVVTHLRSAASFVTPRHPLSRRST